MELPTIEYHVPIIIDVSSSLEHLISYIVLLEEYIPHDSMVHFEEVLSCLTNIMVHYIEEEFDEMIRSRGVAVGRPSLLIEEHLQFFVDNGFKVYDMALMLGCSQRTVEQRLQMYSLSTRNYTMISDFELDEIVLHICSAHPR